jgi:hypothetical protein
MKLKTPISFVCAVFWVTYSVPGAVIVFQDGATNQFSGNLAYSGTDETTIWEHSPNDNTGARAALEIGSLGEGEIRRSIIRFDVTSLLGQYSTINSVTLRFTSATTPDGTDFVQAFQIAPANSTWVEGTGIPVDFLSDSGSSTWNERVGGLSSWAGSAGLTSAETDYLTNLVASAQFSFATQTNGSSFNLVFTDPTILDAWVAGTNSGLLLMAPSEGVEFARFIPYASDFNGNLAFRPQLIVDFDPVIVPEPGSAMAALLALVSGFSRRQRATRR